MYKNLSKTMDELMEYLLFETKNRNLPISEFKMQKLIFKIKMKLGKDHKLYPQLPFYWYLKGPYSKVVTNSYEKIFPQINKSKPKILNKYQEIEDINCQILDNKEYFLNEIDKDIYREYAPYSFMYLYKYKIYDIAKTIEKVDFDAKNLIRVLAKCEGRLPIEEYFFDFNDVYSDLFTNLELIRKVGNFEKYWNIIRNPLILTWKTFAKGVRIYHKDDYYNNNVDLWKIEYQNSLNELSEIVKKTRALINFDDYPKNSYTKEQKKLLNSTIGAYLRD